MNTGRPIVGCHDGSDYLLGFGYGARPWIGDFDVFLSESRRAFLLDAVLVMNPLLLAFRLVGAVLEADAQGVLLGGELVDQIARVTPEGKVGVRIGRVEGGVDTVLVVVVEQMGGVGGAAVP